MSELLKDLSDIGYIYIGMGNLLESFSALYPCYLIIFFACIARFIGDELHANFFVSREGYVELYLIP